MDATLSQELSIPEDVLKSLIKTSNSSTLNESLEILIRTCRSDEGRSSLASKDIIRAALQLSKSFACVSAHDDLLVLSLRLLRNLCAGELVNQNLFIELNGVEVVSGVINGVGFDCDDSGYGIIRTALQLLANISLAGVKHQRAIWDRFFPNVFLKIARVRRRETCDPLSMIVYTCSDGSSELFSELCKSQGLAIIAEIVSTASEVGFGEDWLKLLISRICLHEPHFPVLFGMLSENVSSEDLGDVERNATHLTSAQAYHLRMVSEIFNERRNEINISTDFALNILGIFETAVKAVDFHSRGQSGLPAGSNEVDILGYSLTLLKDTCAHNSSVVNTLVSNRLLDLLLKLLCELERPSSIRRTARQDESQMPAGELLKVCPYKGFRKDIVAVIGNCSYRRKHVQDYIRQKNGLILILQQCVLDEDNSFLREWGIWCAKNLLEGNAENQRVVAGLEMQGVVDVPQLAEIGLRAEVDPNTRRARLVSIS
ncbi:uncharacterized protein LOC141586039 isoform X2 [Silene latifolia]|uniref:uncharacterized protein LOC141586039 isoform X2 n=1 Tax=Silene latifolia TaxID=37657 RepID=UPI003D7804ED